jgi:hypothetical protein
MCLNAPLARPACCLAKALRSGVFTAYVHVRLNCIDISATSSCKTTKTVKVPVAGPPMPARSLIGLNLDGWRKDPMVQVRYADAS